MQEDKFKDYRKKKTCIDCRFNRIVSTGLYVCTATPFSVIHANEVSGYECPCFWPMVD
jgi:hypothetical protein